MIEHLGLLPIGVLVGALGTLIGAGGGFLLMPLLLFLYPEDPPELLTGISLAVVFANSASGSYAYAKKGRIDYPSAFAFAIASLPGAVFGAWLVGWIPAEAFRFGFGLSLLLAGGFLIWRAGRAVLTRSTKGADVHRRLTDADGQTWTWSYRRSLGLAVAAVVGVLSSLLGIGGGIIHVPAMIAWLGYPVHLATATSHLVLGITAAFGLLTRWALGGADAGFSRAVPLMIGAVIGAQLGAKLSDRIGGPMIVRALAVALCLVGLRLLWAGA